MQRVDADRRAWARHRALGGERFGGGCGAGSGQGEKVAAVEGHGVGSFESGARRFKFQAMKAVPRWDAQAVRNMVNLATRPSMRLIRNGGCHDNETGSASGGRRDRLL